MPYDTRNVLESEKAYEVFREIIKNDEGNYSSNIAEKIDMKRPLASEIIGKLKEVGVLKKGKRTRAQYYKVNKKGLAELFGKEWDRYIKEENIEELENISENLDQETLNKLPRLIYFYSGHHCKMIEDSSIREMLTHNFYSDLEEFVLFRNNIDPDILEEFGIDIEDGKVPKWIKQLYGWLSLIYPDRRFSELITASLISMEEL